MKRKKMLSQRESWSEPVAEINSKAATAVGEVGVLLK